MPVGIEQMRLWGDAERAPFRFALAGRLAPRMVEGPSLTDLPASEEALSSKGWLGRMSLLR